MPYTEPQQREDRTNAGRCGEKEEVLDERDEPTPRSKEPPSRNRIETTQQYYDRLEAWGDEQRDKIPIPTNKDNFDDILKRIRAIDSKVADAKLEDKDATIKYHDNDCSVEQLLDVHEGLPKLMINTSAEPSIKKQTWRNTVAEFFPSKNRNGKRENDDNDEVGDEVGPKKTKGLGHATAEIRNLVVPFGFKTSFKDLNVNFKEIGANDVVRKVTSVLGACLGTHHDDKSAQLSNFNESSPSFYIVAALKDVLCCLGFGVEAQVAQEMSFFSMRPDIVVLKYMNAIVLIIEVKNEGRNPDVVMGSDVAAGQCLDYTYAMKKCNIDIPIVCLSTYSKMRIGSSEENIALIVSEAFERLGKVNEKTPFGRIPVKGKTKPKSSPEKKGNATKVPCDKVGKTQQKWFAIIEKKKKVTCDSSDRRIYFSDTFEYENMFKALYLAVACGCISAEKAAKAINGDVSDLNENRIPLDGEVLKDHYYNVVQVDSYTWTKVSETKVTYELKTSWRKCMKIFMGVVLGMGNTGKVYLCMDSVGRHFALKMLFYDSKVMEDFDPNRRMASRKEHMKKLENNLQTEAKRWKTIYPQYRKAIWKGTLNQQPCLAMPYIASIPTERREELLGKIQEEMERIADLGFVYKESDTRWRHIGLRMNEGNEKVIFVDMESFEEVGKNLSVEDRNEYVEIRLKDLYARSSDPIANRENLQQSPG